MPASECIKLGFLKPACPWGGDEGLWNLSSISEPMGDTVIAIPLLTMSALWLSAEVSVLVSLY